VSLLAVVGRIEAATTETERLVTVGKLWGKVKFFHPWLQYKPIDWDAALVKVLPKVRTAATDDELAAAVGELLGALGDPATRVEKAGSAPTAPAAATPATAPSWYHWHEKTLVVTCSALPAAMEGRPYAFSRPLVAELAKADALVVDARLGGADPDMVAWALTFFDDQLAPEEVTAPATRAVLLNGYPPQLGISSGGYYVGFVVKPGRRYKPDKPTPKRPVVFIARPEWLPNVAVAVAAAGKGSIVSTGPLADAVQVARLRLSREWHAIVRVSETIGAPLKADVEIAGGQDPLPVALALAARLAAHPKPTAARGSERAAALPPPVWHPDNRYQEMTYPSAEYRLLAVFRMWNVIRYFYPYLALIDDWEPVLAEFVPKIIDSADGKAYALSITEMASRIADGHTRVYGHPALTEMFGMAIPPIEIQMVEGVPTVVKLLDPDAAKGLRLGDVIVDVEGEPAEEKMKRLAPYVSASTPDAARARLANQLWRGAEGATLTATVRDADGPRPATITLSTKYYRSTGGKEHQPAYRLLSPDIGYADLTKMMPAEVHDLFEAFKDAKAIIFDMRGYPNATAWVIAPRINVNNAKIGAQFRRPLWSGFDLENDGVGGTASYAFDQPLPPTTGAIYKGKTVMLIDDRAISQSEHTGLFFEAAAGTVFIGTPTAGANGDTTTLTLPGGIQMSFTGHDVRHADGRQLQRVGLLPHIRVAPTLAGLRAGKDEVLDRALQYLQTGK
jgi:C-terminal processing protease CtpA/Prc